MVQVTQNPKVAQPELLKKAQAWLAARDDHTPEHVAEGLAMADILAELNMDAESLTAAALLPYFMMTQHSTESLHEDFSASLISLLGGVLQMQAMQVLRDEQTQRGEQLNKLRRMLLAMVEDIRVVLIKIAERLYVMRHLRDKPAAVQQQVATQALNLYAPLANRLGIGQVKWELEDLAFRYLQPANYKNIAGLLDEKRIDRENYIDEILNKLNASLSEDGIQNADVEGRVKHIYSIWRKMQRKGVDYDEIYDVRAVRILVDEIKDCYAALGTVHRQWQHIPKEFDDYIATPKENGYRSLHTAVVGPAGKTLEVQIRTRQMHEESELGVASHWRYKEGVAHDSGFEQKLQWLRQLLEWQEEVSDADELMEALHSNIIEERVYALTPNGDVIDLPHGATPLDFAYTVHTSVGHRCRGAKINGHIVPLTYQLKTGEQVEILTTKEGKPSRDWLNQDLGYLHTSRARSKVQAWFRQQNRDQNIIDGRFMLDKELERLAVKQIDTHALAEKFNFKTGDEIYAALGRGDIKPAQVLHAAGISLQSLSPERAPSPKVFAPKAEKAADITISGVGNLLTHLAQCCNPVPGDDIIGYVTQGRGVSIHRKDCSNIFHSQESHAERLVQVDWGLGSTQSYPVTIHIEAYDRAYLLRDITGVFSAEKINLRQLQTRDSRDKGLMHLECVVNVADLSLLGRLLDRLNGVPNVIKASRHKTGK